MTALVKGCGTLIIVLIAFLFFLVVYINETAKQDNRVPQEQIERREK